MSKKDMYAQCGLEQQRPEATAMDVAYLPLKFARKGAIITRDGYQGVWRVTWVGKSRHREFVDAVRHACKNRGDTIA